MSGKETKKKGTGNREGKNQNREKTDLSRVSLPFPSFSLMFLLALYFTLLKFSFALPAPGVIVSWAFRENATWTYSHCSSFVRVPSSGAILAVFQSTQSHEGGPTQTKFLVRSTDDGITWSEPSVLVPWTNVSGKLTLPWDGTLFLDTTGALRYVFVTSPYQQQSAGDLFTISSGDEGVTWSAPTLVFPRSVWGRIMSNINPPVLLRNGALALPVNTVPGNPDDKGPVTMGLLLVGSDGEQWTPLGVMPSNLINISTYIEPAVSTCAPPLDDQLLALLRTNIGELWAARSTDSGASWSVAYKTPFRNPDSKVNLLQWRGSGAGGSSPSDGDLVLTLNPNADWGPSCNASRPYCKRSPLSLAVSRDCGGSWGPFYDVEVDGDGENSFGYPTAHQCTYAGAPAICMTYSLGTDGTKYGGIRFAIVPAGNLV